MAQAATNNLTTTNSLTQLIESQSNNIPDRIEDALKAYVGMGSADPVAVQRIVDLYASGSNVEALKEVDKLDLKLDGKLFEMPLNGPSPQPLSPSAAIQKETLG